LPLAKPPEKHIIILAKERRNTYTSIQEDKELL